jgi:hypothetical protein
MNRKQLVFAFVLVAMIMAAALPAFAAAPDSLTVTAFVQDQTCISNDIVAVTLSATAESSSSPVRFRWDFTNNGSFDTPPSTDATVVRNYPDELNRTARVGARNPEGNLAQDTVQFQTIRCE